MSVPERWDFTVSCASLALAEGWFRNMLLAKTRQVSALSREARKLKG